MLSIRKNISITGECVIDGKTIERYSATVSYKNPSAAMINKTIIDKTASKEYKDERRADQAAFEDAVYALQDELNSESDTEEAESSNQ